MSKAIISILFALSLLGGAWYIHSNKTISFTLLEDKMCRNDNVSGPCKIFIVDNFSKWHTTKQLEDIKVHAFQVTSNESNQNLYSVYYFRNCTWIEDTKNSFHFKPINEIAQWDKEIHPLFPEMSNAYLCRVYFKKIDNKLMPQISSHFLYGSGYLE